MPGAPYDPTATLHVHVVSHSPHTFAYKLWTAVPGATVWDALDAGDIATPPQHYGPFPAETRFAYTLLIAGNPDTDWRIHVLLSQHGAALACAPDAEHGVTSAHGTARRDTGLVLR